MRSGVPFFRKIIIHLNENYYSGKKFVIEANNTSSSNLYIQSAKLNGVSLNKPFFDHADLIRGGVLQLQMGKMPNVKWGTETSSEK